MTKRLYITTAIPYVNGAPHLGHAIEFALTDAAARYRRLGGWDVRFQTGADENSLKNVQAAERLGISTATLVEQNARRFQTLRGPLNLSFDDFIRTSVDERHLAGVRRLWEACAAAGDIYRRAYRGLYCVGCEQFYTAGELVGGLCPEHGVPPEVVEEENYFFRLSRYAEQLETLIANDQLRIQPISRKNEVLAFIRRGLEDFSISRSRARAREWGIPVPGDPSQVIYVWYDALGNYITALDWATDGDAYRRFWVDNPNRVHVIGKGILRFHAIYWPAMLLSADLPLPSEIFVHGYLTVEGRKIGKSLGNSVDPVDLATRFGTDALRYYLLRAIPSDGDGDYAAERFEHLYRADLAGQLGNLLNRTVSLVGRYAGGEVPAPGEFAQKEEEILRLVAGLTGRLEQALARFAAHEALAAIWELVGAANRYVDEVQPWALSRDGSPASRERLKTVLFTLAETLRIVANALSPFLPSTAASIAGQLGVTLPTARPWAERLDWGITTAGSRVQPGPVLFPRMEVREPVTPQ